MSAPIAADVDKMVFRKANSHVGRRASVKPQNSTMKHLGYARIILNSSVPTIAFQNEERETGKSFQRILSHHERAIFRARLQSLSRLKFGAGF